MYNVTSKIWRIDVLLTSDNSEFMGQLKFILVNTTWSFETNVTFNKHLSISLTISDDQVQRWWPNGFGDQILYRLSVSHQEEEIGSRVLGFRTVELIQRVYSSNINGTSFYFSINSQPIFIKGSNWIPSDAFQERVSDEKLERLLSAAQIANMNMLRVWGGGIYERDSFYDMADRLGIMLWHDFMFACSL
jgi:beta-mannosidase